MRFGEGEMALVPPMLLFNCQDDAGLAHLKVTVSALMSFSYDENYRFKACIANRLCGPGEKILADTMETCCAYAFASKAPSFCLGK